MEKEEIVTRTGKIWLGEDGILRFIYSPGTEVTLTDTKENVAVASKIIKGKRRPALTDFRGLKSMTREARVYYSGEEVAKYVNAGAVVIGSPVSRIIGNFFMGLNKSIIPNRLFTSESQAIEWLKGFIE